MQNHVQCLTVSTTSLLDFLICFILAVVTGIYWLQYLQMETKHRCANTDSRFVSIQIFISSRTNSFPWIIQTEAGKVPYIKKFILGTVETTCTTAPWMGDYFLMLFWSKSVSFYIVAITVVFLRRSALPTWVPLDTAAIERAEAHLSNSRTTVTIWTLAEHNSTASKHQLILHILKAFGNHDHWWFYILQD